MGGASHTQYGNQAVLQREEREGDIRWQQLDQLHKERFHSQTADSAKEGVADPSPQGIVT